MIGTPILVLSALISMTLGEKWNYSNFGIDWVGSDCDKREEKSQSPIDIITKECRCNDKISLDIDFIEGVDLSASLKMFGNPLGPKLLLNSQFAHLSQSSSKKRRTYKAFELVFRAPSEHSIDAIRFPLELQISFRSTNDEILGLSLLFNLSTKGISNVIFEDFLDNLRVANMTTGSSAVLKNYSNYNKILTENLDFYQYMGTMTDTDCSREVTWIVLKQRLWAKKESVTEFQNLLEKMTGVNQNARLIQPSNSRIVLYSSDRCSYEFANIAWLSLMYAGLVYFTYKML